jgi:hypothetical protein
MKKQYINPSMEVVEIKAQQLLAGSPQLNGTLVGGDPILGREADYDAEDASLWLNM